MTEYQLMELFPDIEPNLLFEVYEERAAIREYEGNYSREEAERLAVQDLRELF